MMVLYPNFMLNTQFNNKLVIRWGKNNESEEKNILFKIFCPNLGQKTKENAFKMLIENIQIERRKYSRKLKTRTAKSANKN